MNEQLALLPVYLTGHLQLSLVALLFGTMISVPVGVWATRQRYIEQPVMAVASIIQTVPSLALLAVMVPLLAALEMRSIGYLPALIGLTLYSVLPILRNTVTGISGVNPALVEAARGVGMTPAQQLRKVELPLAMPVIIAGIRTSTVWVVGTATLSTPVGAPSLGNYIFSGLQTRNYTSVLIGCVASAVLALILDALVRMIEAGLAKRQRSLVIAALAALGACYVYVGYSLVEAQFEEEKIRIGAKTFTEQHILSEMIAQHIESETDIRAETLQSLGSTVAFDALSEGQIDVTVEYTGTIWASYMDKDFIPDDREQVLEQVRQFVRKHGIELVGRLGFENTYAVAMKERDAERIGATKISDLSSHAPGMTLGSDYEFFGRNDWYVMRDKYGLEFDEFVSMDSALMYSAIAEGQVDVITAFSTDGRIEALNLRILEDDREAIPPYEAVILARGGLAAEHPKVMDALRDLTQTLSDEKMRKLNAAVDADKRRPAEVASEFLKGLQQGN